MEPPSNERLLSDVVPSVKGAASVNTEKRSLGGAVLASEDKLDRLVSLPSSTKPVAVEITVVSRGKSEVAGSEAAPNLAHSLAPFVPLLQTLSWVVLIVFIVWRFYREIKQLIGAFRKRIDDGSSVKAGMVEIGQRGAFPQTTEEQKDTLKKEMVESSSDGGIELEASCSSGPFPKSESVVRGRPNLASNEPPGAGLELDESLNVPASNYVLAEDLVMRRIQDDYNEFIFRRLKIDGMEVDGVFKQGILTYAVEVKYFPSNRLPEVRRRILKSRVGILLRTFDEPENTRIIIALVFEQMSSRLKSEINELRQEISDRTNFAQVTVFTLDGLKGELGI